MSTKINARSPYFLNFTSPTESLGAFSCTGNKFQANLSGFSVNAYGVIQEPVPQNGSIVARSETSFAENTGSSVISRSVTYTIQIPLGYSNSGTGTNTILCSVTTDQPIKAVATGGANCPTFSGTIPTQSIGSTGSTAGIILSTFFTRGSGAVISGYAFTFNGDSAIVGSIDGGNVLRFRGTTQCMTGKATVRALNASDGCEVTSNEFTVSTLCNQALGCTTDTGNNIVGVDLTQLTVYSDGSADYGSFLIGLLPSEIAYNFNSAGSGESWTAVSDSFNLSTPGTFPANTTGSARNIYLRIKWIIPAGFTNHASSPLVCYYGTSPVISQDSTLVKTFSCASMLSNVRVLPDGTVTTPTISEGGTFHSTTLASPYTGTGKVAANNTSGTVNWAAGQITHNITLAATYTATVGGVTYTAGQQVPCTRLIRQSPQPSNNICGSTSFYISYTGFSFPLALCNNEGGFAINVSRPVTSTVSSAVPEDHLYATICSGSQRLTGGNLYYAVSQNENSNFGGVGGVYYMAKIDNDGIVQEITSITCSSTNYQGGSSNPF